MTPLFTGTLDQTRRAREKTAERFSTYVGKKRFSKANLAKAYQDIHAFAEDLSGTSIDAGKRAVLYYSIYEDSQGNFMFPLVATHGSLWGVRHTLRIERALTPLTRVSRHGTVQRWIDAIDAVRDVNRRVFVEIYTTFYFTRYFGDHAAASEHIKPELLALYNRVHQAIRDGRPLSHDERQEIYFNVFVHEQDMIVDPGVNDAAKAAGSALLLKVLQRVQPRFTYFPPGERLRFTDFTDVEQRNREGLRALAFAEQVGAERVFEAMAEY
jgi:hypothetical protein